MIQEVIDKALAGKIAFPEIIVTLTREDVESNHVDLLRNEFRYYAKNGESFVTSVVLVHEGIAGEFSAEALRE
ncbi:MAG: hypothetical protein WAK48_22665 [Candidatus Acidiferrum sp.]